jgi:hypothetical protein
MNDLLFNVARFFALKSQALRPVVRVLVPHSWQMSFSNWVLCASLSLPKSHASLPRSGRWASLIYHRLYWLSNPRGEEIFGRLGRRWGQGLLNRG